MNVIRRVIRKPPSVIAFRATQELRLQVMHHLKTWFYREKFIDRWWNNRLVQDYATSRKNCLGIISPDAAEIMIQATQQSWLNRDKLITLGKSMAERKFDLLGTPVPDQGTFPWHEDWQWDYHWQPAYFRSYNFYSERQIPYDVKRPWELSRMGFILPILQNAAIEPEHDWIDVGIAIISDWQQCNPLAYTVNWYPMEASMRGINLVFALEMLLAMGESRSEVLGVLLRLISTHGEFVWRTIEYTDIRGNHYAANLVALLLFGLALEGFYPSAERWLTYAVKAIPPEIECQFLPDGVNFEKSMAYHRLVTELFLIGVIAIERAGEKVPLSAKKRLHLACQYTAACTRPDGFTPNVGDNDDAHVLGFDPLPLRDHRSLLGLGAAFFSDPDLKSTAGDLSAAVIWCLGSQGVAVWQSMPTRVTPGGTKYFPDGGVVVVKQSNNFLWMDVGEVGLAGRGGHGHNDMLSFELFLQGIPLVVDPGCFVYSPEPETRNLFRSTAYHNGLRLDGVEISPISGMWRIGNDAIPQDVAVRTQRTTTHIRASHNGYCRLPDPVIHTRSVQFNPEAGTCLCIDYLEGTGCHIAERYLHLDPVVKVILANNRCTLSENGYRWIVQWGEATQAHIEVGWVSPGYGIRQAAKILVLTDSVKGSTELSLTIKPI